MADDPGELVELYRAGSLPEAQALLVMLEDEGVPARVDNELLQGAVGELPAGWATAPRLLVGRAHEAAARAVLDAFLQNRDTTAAGDESRCLACGAAMGEAVACPSCGWSFTRAATPVSEGTASEAAPVPAGVPPPTPGSADPLTGAARRALWLEVGVVLAVGVVPHLVSSAAILATPVGPLPYWLDTLQLVVLSACTAYVVLYLISRSGEPWDSFGLARPLWWDVPMGLVLVFLAAVVARLAWDLTPDLGGGVARGYFPRARGAGEYAMMAAKYAANGFAEELVTRAYLITRLRVLLRSPAEAVVAAAVLFASYHVYQGAAGAIHALLFGLAYGGVFLLIRRVWPLALGHALYGVRAELLVP
jgi:Putative prokaryotic signal transducing protein/Type II CAAX prenyl endopeptidase Rce1-like